MREILFKAKRLDNGKWVEGYYLDIAKIDHFIGYVTMMVVTKNYNKNI